MNQVESAAMADAAALAHSRRLEALIRREIEQQGGQIPFARFMELALYAPGLGYYSAGTHKIGAGGDFVTAPEISPLFSRCLAHQCREVLMELSGGDILEVGGGSGRMVCDILLELERLGCLPDHYYILETSADLCSRQQAMLSQKIPKLAHHVCWLKDFPPRFVGVVLANELLDAMPAHRFSKSHQGVEELYVAVDEDRFITRIGAISEERIDRRVAEIEEQLGGPLPDGYQSEIQFAAEAWVRTLAGVVERGIVLILDYGYPRREYYHPQRTQGTLMCYHKHHATSDPLVQVGLQDITSHIDFTGIAISATDAGFEVGGYTTQAYFLMGCGLADLMQHDNGDIKKRIQLAQQAKMLTLPGEMGELVKVIGLRRNTDMALRGFSMCDQRHRL